VEAIHTESVPVIETWNGQTVWDGVVEVFNLLGYLETDKAYGWAHETDDPKNPRRYVTVLHVPPAITPLAAVRASIIRDYHAGTKAESPSKG
jgi:hypothetical protein